MTELRCRKTLEEEREEDDTQDESKLDCERKGFSFISANYAVSFLCTSIWQLYLHF